MIKTQREELQTMITTQDKKTLPIKAFVQIYPRVSTPEQKKNVSAEMQQDKQFALRCGWTEELIIMDTRDLGVSGRLRMEQREAFSDMIVRISQGKVKIIIAANVSRLFRDRWGREYARFMEICYTYGVRVVIPNKTRTGIEYIYDFSMSTDVELFRRKCEESWSYIENHVGMMHAYRNELGYSGCWVGGMIPSGFTINLQEFVNGKENPCYQKYTPYTPWAVHVARLTQRYRELAGNINELFRELEATGFLFPSLDETYPKELRTCIPITAVYENPDAPKDERVIKGYRITSLYGLASILRQPANIGHFVYKGVIRYNNHPAIVDYMDFIYAFNRLSPVNLDGTPNTTYLERAGRYVKRYSSEKPAYLKNHIRPADEKRFTSYTKDVETKGRGVIPFYHFYRRGGGVNRDEYMVSALDVDKFFLARFVQRLQTPVAQTEFESFLDQDTAEQQAHIKRLAELQVHIEATKSLMAKLKRRISNIENKKKDDSILTPEEQKAEEEAEAELVDEINKAYRGHKLELARLENEHERLITTGSEVEKRRSYKKFMRDTGEAWEEVVTQEDIIELIALFVEKVVYEQISPQFFTLTIFWKDDEWEIDHAIIFKGACPSPQWSKEEEAILRRLYPSASGKDLLQALPLRSLEAMKLHAFLLGIKRPGRKKEGNVRIFCLKDLEIMQQCGLDPYAIPGKAGAKLASGWHIVSGDGFTSQCT
jgi:predicted site-specific integrase-resolvase